MNRQTNRIGSKGERRAIPEIENLNTDKDTVVTLVRHAEVAAPYQGIFGGVVDMDLSPRGHEQAAALANYLHKRTFDAIYASPMKRVQQTLSPLLVNGCPRPIYLQGLKELDFGAWTGMPWKEIQEKFGVSAHQWLLQLEAGKIPNAESVAAFRARVEPCLRQMLSDQVGKQVAVVCHGGVIRMILAILLEWPISRIAAFELQYASLTQVSVQDGQAHFRLLNFTPWRELPADR